MNVIKEVLFEEMENSIRIKERYIEALKQIPRGSLRKKKIKGHEYYYLVYRDGAKVRYSYVGKLSEKCLNEYKEARAKRSEYKEAIRKVDQQINYLKKVINVRAK